MHRKYVKLDDRLYDYLLRQMTPPDDVLRDLAAETAKLGRDADMQIAHEQGAFLTMLCRLTGAKHAIEIGTFTGYSTICIARGLSRGGALLTFDISETWTAIAKRYAERARLTNRIEFLLGPAIEILRALPETPDTDLAFVDADKTGYRDYYEALLPRVRQNGVILFDNTLWDGAVAGNSKDPDTRALRELNAFLANDPRVEVVLLPIADGLTLARKK